MFLLFGHGRGRLLPDCNRGVIASLTPRGFIFNVQDMRRTDHVLAQCNAPIRKSTRGILTLVVLFSSAFLTTALASSDAKAPSLKPAPSNQNVASATATNTNVIPSLSETPDDKLPLAPGDRVSFRVVEDRGEPKLLTVADSGELEVPYIGRVMARGRTCKDLTAEIREKLEQKYYHRATVVLSVDLLNTSRGMVYLFGEVRAPGSQSLPSGERLTLAKAIIRAGGLTDFADKQRVKVTRESVSGPASQVFTVDVGRVLQKGQLDKDLTLEPGDIIYVPGRLVNF